MIDCCDFLGLLDCSCWFSFGFCFACLFVCFWVWGLGMV